ncbi:hypothetical protein BKA57DRAFT_466313 [Linnemannia elongata]|nr:hypothetical protein BKA57DRAFT_466313 [Linnemannia elongata]
MLFKAVLATSLPLWLLLVSRLNHFSKRLLDFEPRLSDPPFTKLSDFTLTIHTHSLQDGAVLSLLYLQRCALG